MIPMPLEERARRVPAKISGQTDREYRLMIRKAHMLGENTILCGADKKKKVSIPFLVTRKWEKVTCKKCLEMGLAL